jgi:very-short-patch-repair endonuclease
MLEERIRSLAATQHGVVTRSQLIESGLGADAIDHRVSTHRLRALHRGVYLIGPLLPRYAPETAALLACGAGAVLSHHTAAVLWELLHESAHPIVHVSLPSGKRSTHPGLVAHAPRGLPADEVTRRHGLSITTVARTLLDLAATAGSRDLEQALGRSFRNGLVSPVDLSALLARYPRRRGTGRLRRALGGDGPAFTRSPAEDRFLELIRRARLGQFNANARVAGHEVDFYWPAERFVVEVDGYAFHSSPEKFETDRRRDSDLAAAGVHVMRVTWRQLANEPEALLVKLAQALTLARFATLPGTDPGAAGI